MIRMIKSGGIFNCPYTVQDVLIAQKIFGPDIAALKGKTTRSKTRKVEVDHLSWRPIRMVQTMCVDLFYVAGLWFFISLTLPLRMLMVNYLPTGKKLAGIWKSIMSHVRCYRGRRFEIGTLQSDSESGILALEERIKEASIDVDIAASNSHVKELERVLRPVKEGFRGTKSILPFGLSKKLAIYLVYYVVIRLNQRLYDSTPGAMCPFSNFRGRKLDAKLDFSLSFGDYVQVHEDNGSKQNTDLERTTGAIFVLPTGNLSGSCKFLSLATGEIITREKWTVVPMPQDVIDKLNADALKDGCSLPRDLVFQYRDRPIGNELPEEPVPEPIRPMMTDPSVTARELGPVEMDESDGGVVLPGESVPDEVAVEYSSATVQPDRSPVLKEFERDLEEVRRESGYNLRGASDEAESEVEDEAEPPAQNPNVRPARARERRDYRDLANRGTTGGDPLPKPGGGSGRGVSYFTRSVRRGYSGKNVAYHITVSEALRRIPKSAINSLGST
jgi:hypothetical protein